MKKRADEGLLQVMFKAKATRLKQTVSSGGSRGGAGRPDPPLIFAEKKINNEKTQKEEKAGGQAIFANQFHLNISKNPGAPLSSRPGSATGECISNQCDHPTHLLTPTQKECNRS